MTAPEQKVLFLSSLLICPPTVEVPGCDPYREYLYSLLRQQPIWQLSRFWNTVFHDTMQSEREHRLASQLRRQQRRQAKQQQRMASAAVQATAAAVTSVSAPAAPVEQPGEAIKSSSSSSHHPTAGATATAKRKVGKCNAAQQQTGKEPDDIVFRQLG